MIPKWILSVFRKFFPRSAPTPSMPVSLEMAWDNINEVLASHEPLPPKVKPEGTPELTVEAVVDEIDEILSSYTAACPPGIMLVSFLNTGVYTSDDDRIAVRTAVAVISNRQAPYVAGQPHVLVDLLPIQDIGADTYRLINGDVVKFDNGHWTFDIDTHMAAE